MNNRIKELARQAKNFMTDQVLYESRVHNRTLSVDKGADIFEEKFAELIVQECIDTVLDSSVEYTTRPRIAQELKEHFGVEE